MSPSSLRPGLLLAAALAASAAQAATWQVGPTRSYTTLNALFAAVDLGAGDVVEVEAEGIGLLRSTIADEV